MREKGEGRERGGKGGCGHNVCTMCLCMRVSTLRSWQPMHHFPTMCTLASSLLAAEGNDAPEHSSGVVCEGGRYPS